MASKIEQDAMHRLVEALRKCYPTGTRVVLVKMDDVQAPPIGTQGTVTGVDDIGTIMVDWDNGSKLGVVFGEDICQKVNIENHMQKVLKRVVANFKKQYPKGTQVKLVEMKSEDAPPKGTLGTVTGVDESATILVDWDNGVSKGLVFGMSECRIIGDNKNVERF